jgi:monothiol glutaredoxin
MFRTFSRLTRLFSTNSTIDPKAKAKIEELLKSSKVVLFMKGTPEVPRCGFSKYAVKVLNQYKVNNFTFFNVFEDNLIREELKKYSDWPTYPQLYIDSEFIGGADILKEMHLSDSLKPLLEKHGVISGQL